MLKVVDNKKTSSPALERIILTPAYAMELLEHNTLNRPLSDAHARRIVTQILAGKWKFNGDTIKISTSGDVLDGQHRLWACIESKMPIETVIVRNVDPAAFATIDTIRKSRTAGDALSLMGLTRHRNTVGGALMWLVRWQRNVLPDYRAPQNRVENADVETAFTAHPQIAAAAQRAITNRRIGNPSLLTFIYYVAANRNLDIADKFMAAIEDPAGLALSHPFYQFRAYLTTYTSKRKEPEHTIALAFKAMNAVAASRPIKLLKFVNQGRNAEPFPKLEI